MEALALAFIAGIAAWILIRTRRRGAVYRRLAREGVPVQAVVTKRFSRRHPKNRQQQYHVAYRFETGSGEVYERQVHVPRADYEQAKADGQIEVRYLADNPATNHTVGYLRNNGFLN